MKRAAIALADAFGRNALRRPVYAALLVVPPLMGLLIRPMPLLLGRLFPAFDFAAWMPLFLAVAAGFPPYLFGLLAALQLLDERDCGLLPAFRVSPMSKNALLAAKAVPAAALAAFGTAAALLLTGQAASVPPFCIAAAGIIAAPSAVFYALVVTGLARTKLQGLTAGKVLGTVLPAPVIWSLAPSPWRWFALPFPSTWAGAAMTVSGASAAGTAVFRSAVGMVYVSVLATLAWILSRRRYFSD